MNVLADLKAQSTWRYVSPFNFALIYAGVGDRDRAMEWLEKAYAEHSPSLSTLEFSPAFTTVRSEPRFSELVRRIGLP